MMTTAALRVVLRNGLRRGLRGAVWMLKIMVPCSFLTFMIDVSGLLKHFESVLAPAMGVLSLPPEAALPLAAGLLAGIYGAVAAMAVLDFSMTEAILIAVFLLIAHNIIQEGIVQARSGLSFLKATLIRLSAAVVTVLCLSALLPASGVIAVGSAPADPSAVSWSILLLAWLWDTVVLSFQILAIITAMMILMEMMRAIQAVPFLARVLQPVLGFMGLSRRVGILWLTAAVFGLSYGAAVIVEEAREGGFEKEEIEGLQISVGINHAMIEDPAVFMALGIPALWLWGPRLLASLVAVHLYRLGYYWKRQRQRQGRSEGINPWS